MLPDGPETADFLSGAGKDWLGADACRRTRAYAAGPRHPFRRLLDGRVLMLGVFFIMFNLAGYTGCNASAFCALWDTVQAGAL